LKLDGREALVVGAGTVAERKIEALLEAGARVRVVAPDATARVHELASAGSLEWSARPFVDSDADGAWLVVAATADAAVQHSVAAAAEARKIFAVAVDDPENASAYSAAVVVRPPLTIAISSSGALPALTRLLREIIEDILPAQDWIEHARALRARWLADKTPAADRFGDLVRELAAKRP
jgi:uroporphyrin-III C-methyltransferase/precorrin-2 dehydrogenase/sirohydrochlorin ferrochelatase